MSYNALMREDNRALRAVLFDLDGTLIHSVDHIVACWQHTVRTCLGREITREEVLPTLGRTLHDAFEEMAPGRSDEMLAVYRAYQVLHHDKAVTLVPGTHETLGQLKDAGFILGLVTSKGIPATTAGLNLFDLWPFFSVVVTMEDTQRHKPNPDPLLVASQKLSIEPESILYVGDAVVDILAGKAAGTGTAGVTWGAGTRDDLLRAAPDYMFNYMEEITPALALYAHP